jgi:membrane protein required for colicin V production
MTIIDFLFIGLITLFTIRCFLKGFINELFSVAAILFGLLTSIYFFKNGAVFLKENFLQDAKSPLPEILAFLGLFIIVFLFVKLLEILLREIIYRLKMGGADRFLGILFGFAEGIAVVSLLLFLIKYQPLFDPDNLLEGSFFANLLLPLITNPEHRPELITLPYGGAILRLKGV